MVRRLLVPVVLVGLGLAGAASAALVTGRSPAATTGSATTGSCGTTTAATSTAPTTTAITSAPIVTSFTTTIGVPAGSTTVTTSPCPPAGSTTAKPLTTGPATTATSATTAPIVATPAAFLTSSAASTLVFTGHGWGHGIGMSQWGADGYATHGWSYTRILAHYYPGTTVARGPSPIVHVLLLDRRRRVALGSESPWHVVDGLGTRVELPAGRLVLPASLVVSGKALTSPLTFSPGTTPVEVGKKPYRGALLVVSNGKRLQVVNAVGLEAYIQGVVGAEVPSTWPQAALEAQAVAARSYALAELQTVVKASPFDVYADTRSQVYGGIGAEMPSVTQAVAATSRQVVLYGGKVATTYFSSSSGGRTVSSAEATGKAVPYLVSVADPYDTVSPYHDWGPVLVDARKAAKELGLPGPLVDLEATPGPSGHMATVTAIGPTAEKTLTGADVRLALGLRSSWFQVGWLALAPPAEPVPPGGSAVLTGVSRGLTDVALEAKASSGEWQPLGAVTPDATGAFSITVRPQATTQYRLATGNVRAALVRVPVAPLVNAVLVVNTVHGTVSPATAGTVVEVQRQDGKAWRAVATGIVDSAGAYAVQASLAPGTYRVRCAPGHGLAPGISSPLVVP